MPRTLNRERLARKVELIEAISHLDVTDQNFGPTLALNLLGDPRVNFVSS